MEELRGSISKIVWQSSDGGYAVARVKGEDGSSQTLVGDLGGLSEGEVIRATGRTEEHARFGRQFRAESVVPSVPHSLRGVRRYLDSGALPGIGPKLAERLVETLGEGALELIRTDHKAAERVPGIGSKKAVEIHRKLKELEEFEETQVFLQGLNLGPGLVARLLRRYGADSLRKVRESPYRLCEEVEGIGFKTADRIAAELGIESDSLERAGAALAHLLGEAAAQGHCYLPHDDLEQRAQQLLGGVDATRLAEAFQRSVDQGRLVAEERSAEEGGGEAVFQRRLHVCEVGATALLKRLRNGKAEPLLPTQRWHQLAGGLSIDLDPSQKSAIEMLLNEPLAILTGGPGVGKTTILRLLIRAAEEAGWSYALAAPTGRAARRLAESTGREAKTLHRLLQFEPMGGRFQAGPEKPIDAQLVVVDEVSMTDIALFYNLLRAIVPPTRLVLVGDADQLPSVGAGAVLRDLVASKALPCARLQKIFRQASGSRIVAGAHEVLDGKVPQFAPKGEESDLFFWPCEGSTKIADGVCELVTERIPKRFGFDPVSEVQVLAPMYRGPCGVDALNERLRSLLNPTGASVQRGDRVFRAGDKVIQLRNDYDREVFNGDVGRVADVDSEGGKVHVAFEDRATPLEYKVSELEDLAPAYAITVHRSQGSEYPAVVLPIAPDHGVLLRRNLVYTALTRGRRLVVLVGSRDALRRAVRSDDSGVRHTRLAERIRELTR